MNRPIGAIPLKPDFSARTGPGIHLERAIIAGVQALSDPQMRGAVGIARANWPGDGVTPLVIKAARAPADSVTPGWAAELAGTGMVTDFVASLAPLSAAARLI